MHERDQEIEDFIRSCPRTMLYSEIEQAIRERFGADRAWSRTRIFNFWNEAFPTTKGHVRRVDLDPEQRAFIEDRLGHLNLTDLAQECRKRFGDQALSRSAIHRHHQSMRGMRKRGSPTRR